MTFNCGFAWTVCVSFQVFCLWSAALCCTGLQGSKLSLFSYSPVQFFGHLIRAFIRIVLIAISRRLLFTRNAFFSSVLHEGLLIVAMKLCCTRAFIWVCINAAACVRRYMKIERNIIRWAKLNLKWQFVGAMLSIKSANRNRQRQSCNAEWC